MGRAEAGLAKAGLPEADLAGPGGGKARRKA
jgi:hypothetical protein